MHVLVRTRAGIAVDVDQAHGRDGVHQRALRGGDVNRTFIQRLCALRGARVFVFRRVADEDQPPARAGERFQPFQRGGAQRFAAGHDHRVVVYAADHLHQVCDGLEPLGGAKRAASGPAVLQLGSLDHSI